MVTIKNYREKTKEYLEEIEESLVECGFEKSKAQSVAKSHINDLVVEKEPKTAKECVQEFLKKCANGNERGYSPFMFTKLDLKKWREYGVRVSLNSAYK